MELFEDGAFLFDHPDDVAGGPRSVPTLAGVAEKAGARVVASEQIKFLSTNLPSKRSEICLDHPVESLS